VRLIQGEAEFVAAPDVSRPFQVAAAHGLIQATGTAFIARRAADRVLVTVTEGTVVVYVGVDSEAGSSVGGDGPGVRLRRGQQVAYSDGVGLGDVWSVDVERVSAWRRGKLIFDGAPVAEAIAELDRYLPGRILIVKGQPSATHVGGIFNLSELDAAVVALATTQKLHLTRLTRFLIILH
jgi:transmembrane sensor